MVECTKLGYRHEKKRDSHSNLDSGGGADMTRGLQIGSMLPSWRMEQKTDL